MSLSFLHAMKRREQDAQPVHGDVAAAAAAAGAAAAGIMSDWGSAEWRAIIELAVECKALEQQRANKLHDELAAAVDDPSQLAVLSSQREKLKAGRIAGMLEAGTQVMLVGLKTKPPQLKSGFGRVLSYAAEKGRYAVQGLTKLGGSAVGQPCLLRPANLEERGFAGQSFMPGESVVLHGLIDRPELNGRLARVESGTMFTSYETLSISRSQERVRCKRVNLMRLSDAPVEVRCDLEDLALDEHPLEEANVCLGSTRVGQRIEGVNQLYVRIHGLQSETGAALNGACGTVVHKGERGRLGVRLDDSGEVKSISWRNLSHARLVVDASHRGTHTPSERTFNERSRAAGDFDAAEPSQPGFYVYYPALRRGAASDGSRWDGGIGGASQCWPGVYTDRRFRGVRTAPSADVLTVGSWEEAWRRWGDLLHDDRPFVISLRAVVAPSVDVQAATELMAWFLQHNQIGAQMVREDGVALCGAHVEDTAAGRFAFWVLSIDSLERRHCPDDVIWWLVVEPNFRLTLRGQPVAFQATCKTSVSSKPNGMFIFEPAPLGTSPSKTRADDWIQLIASSDGDFCCDKWKWHVEPRAGASSAAAAGGGIDFSGADTMMETGLGRMATFNDISSVPSGLQGLLGGIEAENAPIVV